MLAQTKQKNTSWSSRRSEAVNYGCGMIRWQALVAYRAIAYHNKIFWEHAYIGSRPVPHTAPVPRLTDPDYGEFTARFARYIFSSCSRVLFLNCNLRILASAWTWIYGRVCSMYWHARRIHHAQNRIKKKLLEPIIVGLLLFFENLMLPLPRLSIASLCL